MNKIALLFPGQGSQYIGMGKRLFSQFPAAKLIFEEANDILKFDLGRLCFEGSLEELTRTDNTQPAIFTVSVAAYKAYMEEIGIRPYSAAGHSLGEISALCCSDALSFADALRIVQKRGALMHEASLKGQGAMSAIGGIQCKPIEELCKETSSYYSAVGIACYNSPEQIVISGHSEAVERAEIKLKALGAQVTRLKVGAAFHSSLMQGASEAFEAEIRHYQYKLPKWQVISNVNGLPYSSIDEIKQNMVLQLYKPVQWQATISHMYKEGVRTVVELGPNNVLKSLARKNAKHINGFAYDKEEDIKNLIKLTATKDRLQKLTLIDHCLAAAVSTRNYNEDQKEYNREAVKAYKKLEKMQKDLEGESELTMEQQVYALETLKSIFKIKLLPQKEQTDKVNSILKEAKLYHMLTKENV